MNKEGFIKLINGELVDYTFGILCLEENKVKYTTIPMIYPNVTDMFQQGSDLFYVVVQLEDGIYRFGASNSNTNPMLFGGEIGDISLQTDNIEDILEPITKEEFKASFYEVVQKINNIIDEF